MVLAGSDRVELIGDRIRDKKRKLKKENRFYSGAMPQGWPLLFCPRDNREL